MTVGKVYAALMIFDFYKQNKTTRDQSHQAPGGLSQVPLPGILGAAGSCRPAQEPGSIGDLAGWTLCLLHSLGPSSHSPLGERVEGKENGGDLELFLWP